MNHFQRILMCGLLLLLWAAPSLTEAQCRDQSLIWGDDDFGGAVAIEDTIVAVGARLYDFPANDAGRVFMYRRGSADWNLEQELMAFDASAGAAGGCRRAGRRKLDRRRRLVEASSPALSQNFLRFLT